MRQITEEIILVRQQSRQQQIFGGAMRKIILIMLLTFVSSNAAAEWVMAAGDANKHMTVYIHKATIRENYNKVKMWCLYNYKTVQNVDADKFNSYKIQQEFDCKEEQYRGIFIAKYSENMGEGEPIRSGDLGYQEWSRIIPESVMESLWKIACEKK